MHGSLNRFVSGADPYQSDCFDVDRNTVVGERVLEVDADVERLERHDVDAFDAGNLEPGTAAYHFRLASTGEDRHFVRRDLDVVLHVDRGENDEDDYRDYNRNDDDWQHVSSP
ncbi:hypothetical protein GCM10020255_047310 [Rhodococcus baikonurensis]